MSKPTVYYDGACPLCRREIGLYQRGPGGEAIAWQDVSQSTETGEVAPGLTREAALARFHVGLPDGRRVSGAEAFLALWEALPGWRRLAAVKRIPGALPVLEGLYRAFLKVRPMLSGALRRIER
ncbi:MAG: DUF393 domain-containing protein [Pseudomonadota bacterium]